MLRKLIASSSAAALLAVGLVMASPAHAAEGISVSPSIVDVGASPVTWTVELTGLATGTWTGGFPYKVRFAGFTGPGSAVLCTDINAMTSNLGMTTPLPTKGASAAADCSLTGSTVSFHYEPSPSLEAIASRTIKIVGELATPTAGAYYVYLLDGSDGILASTRVCVGPCPVDSTPEAPTVTIDIDSNGGTCSINKVTGYQSTWTTAPKADTCSTSNGDQFVGFNTSANGTGIAIAPGGNLHLTGDNRIYAIYEKLRTPGAPTNVTAVGKWNQVVVSWSPPADAGSRPITNYLVQASPSSQVCITRLIDLNMTECTYTNLVPGTSYTFDVQALNGAGWGAKSLPSTSTTAYNLKAGKYSRNKLGIFALPNAGGSEVVIDGASPGYANGTRITAWMAKGNSQWERLDDAKVTSSNGSFAFKKRFPKKVNASNLSFKFTVGPDTSNVLNVGPLGTKGKFPPGAPKNVVLNKTGRAGLGLEYRVVWSPPSDDGNSAITGYEVRVAKSGWSKQGGADGRSVYVAERYVNGSDGKVDPSRVEVRAKNAEGWGPWVKAKGGKL